VYNGANTAEGRGKVGRRNVGDFDSLELRIFFERLL
jgi:hypothetical protein